MHIDIAERLRPFSHTPGIFFVIPGTSYRMQVFPTCIKIEDLSTSIPPLLAQLHFSIPGPLEKFTVEQDLEKGLIRVWGMSPSGLFRYHLKSIHEISGIQLTIEKAPQEGVAFQNSGKWTLAHSGPLHTGEKRILAEQHQNDIIATPYKIPLIDRLSLGNHKSQDWELMRRRCDFAEIFPIWHRLGQFVPKQANEANSKFAGTLSLIKDCQQSIAASAPEHILHHFENLFLAGFEGGLSPRLLDNDYHGIISNNAEIIENVSSLQLLTQGAELIRSLFVQYNNHSLILLPSCPPSFHCGRLINVVEEHLGTMSIEWTKKSMRCMSFIAATSQKITVSSQDGQQRCRIRQSTKDRGQPFQLGSSLDVIAGRNYWFDNFAS